MLACEKGHRTNSYNNTEHQKCYKGYHCSACNEYFSHKHKLLAHFRTYHGKKPFSCSDCGKAFSNKHLLYTHVRCHTGEFPFACPMCGAAFASRNIMMLHVRCHSNEKPFKCSICNKAFKLKMYLTRHAFLHDASKIVHCPICHKAIHQPWTLKKHQERCSRAKQPPVDYDKRPYACLHCGKRFVRKSHLSGHLLIHSHTKSYKLNLDDQSQCDAAENPFVCYICSLAFVQREDLLFHIQDHACVEALSSESSLCSHVCHHRAVKKSFACSICQEKFRSVSSVMSHVRKTHLQAILRRYHCRWCRQTFMDPELWKIHIKCCQSDAQQYGCNKCSEIFDNTELLQVHVKHFHSGVSRSGSGMHSQTSTKKEHVEIPEQYHQNGEEDYVCNRCDEIFSNFNVLLIHDRYCQADPRMYSGPFDDKKVQR